MKKVMASVLVLVYMLSLAACGCQASERIGTIESDLKTYYEMSDGTWECDGHTYKYRLEISGRMQNAAVDSTFVYLSNFETITFEQAWKAAGLSSNMDDYFTVEDAVLVDWIQTETEYDEAYVPTDIPHFHAKVLEVYDRYMLVEHLPDGKALPADQIEVPFEEITSWPIPAVGDNVEIYYDGTILETYPARLSKVHRVEILTIELTN